MNFSLRAKIPSSDLAQIALAEGRLLPRANFSPENAAARQRHLAGKSFARQRLTAWLREDLGGLPPTEAQSQNLLAAARPETLFVITGQQPGLLGGPLLAWLKALTAIALAKQQSQALGCPVLPLFWIAGDDADLAEANAAEFLWPSDGVTPPLTLPFPDAKRKIPVGDRRLTAEAEKALRAGLPKEWPTEIRRLAKAAYAEGNTLVTGFRQLLQAALGHTGLLFLDGNSPHLRALGKGALIEVLNSAPDFFSDLRRAERRLKVEFDLDPQVILPPHALPAFMRHHGERLRLTSLRADGGGSLACPEAGLAQIGKQPGDLADLDLSHDALTRLLVTEAALPVLGHVLGPAELKYAAQLSEVLPRFTGGQPLLHPRQSLLILPSETATTFDAHGLDEKAWPSLKPSQWRAHLRREAWQARDASLQPPTTWLSAWIAQVEGWQARHLPQEPEPLALIRKLDFALKRYEAGAQEAIARQSPLYRKVTSLLRPLALGAGQDRHVNLMSLMAALDLPGLKALGETLDPLHVGTQIAVIETENPR